MLLRSDAGVQALEPVIVEATRAAALACREWLGRGEPVSTPAAGDVAASLEVLLPEGRFDLLMGVGGTPEGVMTACAARALGGGMQGRLAAQGESEAAALARAGLEVDRVLALDELVGGDCLFVATGISGGALLRAPWRAGGATLTESILVAERTVRWIVEASFEDGNREDPQGGRTDARR